MAKGIIDNKIIQLIVPFLLALERLMDSINQSISLFLSSVAIVLKFHVNIRKDKRNIQ